MRDTGMRSQASRERFRMAEHGQQARGGNNFGRYVLRQGCGVDLWSPSWDGTCTTFRPYPALSPDGPGENGIVPFDPWRFSVDKEEDFGDWIRRYQAVRNFGDPGVTFLLCDPRDQTYDTNLNPAWMLYNNIKRAVEAGQGEPHWAPLLVKKKGRGAPLSMPNELCLVQGALMEHKSKYFAIPRGTAQEDNPVVMTLTSSASKAMLDAMNERNTEVQADPNDFANYFVHGDPISLATGSFVRFYELGHDPRTPQAQAVANFGGSRDERQGGGNKKDIGYGAYLLRESNGISADLSAHEGMVRDRWRPWDDIIAIPSHAEQVHLLSGAFPADAIVFALGELYASDIPQEVRAAAKARRNQVSVPGPGPEAPQQGQQQGWGGTPAPAQAPQAPAAAAPARPATSGFGGIRVDQTTPPPAATAPTGGLAPAQAAPVYAPPQMPAPAYAPPPPPAVYAPPPPPQAAPPAPPPAGYDAPPAAQTPPADPNAVQEAMKRARQKVQNRATNN